MTASKNAVHVEYPSWTPPTKGLLSHLPPSWVPYAELMRLHQPGGMYGGYFPYLIGIGFAASAAPIPPPPSYILPQCLHFLLWLVLLRGAVCTINDNLDKDFDRQVARCRNRPIARGAVTPADANVWYLIQTMAAFSVVVAMPYTKECLGHAAFIFIMLSIYPLAKRVTDFPQVVLSVPLGWAVFMACSAFGLEIFSKSRPFLSIACLFGSQAVWIVLLDYVNACQDTNDDVKAGVRSMAVRYRSTSAFIGTLGTLQVCLIAITGLSSGLSLVYVLIACGGNAAMLLWMAKTVDRSRPETCAWWFLHGSILVQGATVMGLFAEYLSRVLT